MTCKRNSLEKLLIVQRLYNCLSRNWDWIESTDQYWALLSMNMEYLFIYLAPLWFLSLEFCGFPHIDFVHSFVRFIPKYIIFECYYKWYYVLSLNSTCSLLVYRKAIDLCIFTLNPTNLLQKLYLHIGKEEIFYSNMVSKSNGEKTFLPWSWSY